MSQVFLSYSQKDGSELCGLLEERLRWAGYEPFMDKRSLDPGDEFTTVIRQEIEQCDCFVVVVSESAETSQWVKLELQIAQECGQTIIPVRLGDAPLFGSLKDKHSPKFVSPDDWRALDQLVNGLPGGKEIPRVVNCSVHTGERLRVNGLLVLSHSCFASERIETSEQLEQCARKMAKEILPFVEGPVRGIIPNGHVSLSMAMVMWLYGKLNRSPNLHFAVKNSDGELVFSADRSVNPNTLFDEARRPREEQ